jgi:hypothetical protein
VLECLGVSLACGRVEADGDVMVARLVRLAFKAPAGAGRLHGRQLLSLRGVKIRLPTCVGGLTRAACLGPRTSRSGDLSCEVESCRVRVPLVGN